MTAFSLVSADDLRLERDISLILSVRAVGVEMSMLGALLMMILKPVLLLKGQSCVSFGHDAGDFDSDMGSDGSDEKVWHMLLVDDV